MALNTLYNYNPTAPVQITRENYNAVGAGENIVGDVRRAFKGATDFEIWDAAIAGTQLTEGVDYELRDRDIVLSDSAGYDIYSSYIILNPVYQAVDIYITYKIVMTYNDADTINTLVADLDTAEADIVVLQGSVVIPGSILPYGGLSAPTGYLLCDGSAASRSTYATLYGIITTSKGAVTISQANPGIVTLNGHGLITGDCIELTTSDTLPTGLSVNTNYYVYYENANTFSLATSLANAIAGTRIQTTSAGAGTHTLRYCPFGISTSANFLLPDLRNVYLRGANVAARTIAAQASISYPALSVGLLKNDRMQGHYHISWGGYGGGALQANHIAVADQAPGDVTASNPTNKDPYTDGVNGTPRTGTTTEPQACGINYIIKY